MQFTRATAIDFNIAIVPGVPPELARVVGTIYPEMIDKRTSRVGFTGYNADGVIGAVNATGTGGFLRNPWYEGDYSVKDVAVIVNRELAQGRMPPSVCRRSNYGSLRVFQALGYGVVLVPETDKWRACKATAKSLGVLETALAASHESYQMYRKAKEQRVALTDKPVIEAPESLAVSYFKEA